MLTIIYKGQELCCSHIDNARVSIDAYKEEVKSLNEQINALKGDVWIHKQSADQMAKEAHRLFEQIKAKDEALQRAINELGVPCQVYPARVVKAVEILNKALKGGE